MGVSSSGCESELGRGRSRLEWRTFLELSEIVLGFPGGSDGKASACNVGNPGSSPGLGRSPIEENDNPLQYSCLENPMDGGAR